MNDELEKLLIEKGFKKGEFVPLISPRGWTASETTYGFFEGCVVALHPRYKPKIWVRTTCEWITLPWKDIEK